jgi:hypothetical protein
MTDHLHRMRQAIGLPPDAIFLDAIQTAHLTKIHIDIISMQPASSGTWYQAPTDQYRRSTVPR